jgi:hypothetical protein
MEEISVPLLAKVSKCPIAAIIAIPMAINADDDAASSGM